MARLRASQRSMPEHIAVHQGDDFLLVVRGQEGATPLPPEIQDIAAADAHVMAEYGDRPPSPAEREAAAFASAWGWSHDGADPRTWTPRGVDEDRPSRKSRRPSIRRPA